RRRGLVFRLVRRPANRGDGREDRLSRKVSAVGVEADDVPPASAALGERDREACIPDSIVPGRRDEVGPRNGPAGPPLGLGRKRNSQREDAQTTDSADAETVTSLGLLDAKRLFRVLASGGLLGPVFRGGSRGYLDLFASLLGRGRLVGLGWGWDWLCRL